MKPLALALAALLATSPAFFPAHAATPDPNLAPLAFLAGHCWKGELQPNATDEHCFEWMLEGRTLRDRHVVLASGKGVYQGETIYYWNGAARRIEYFYVTAAGGHATGSAIPAGSDAIDFPAAQLVTAARSTGFRGRWTRAGENAYEVLREYETDKGWMPVKVRMEKVAK